MPKKALVVDSDFFFVEFMNELLAKRNYSVLKAYDGKEAIAILQEGPVEVLFADLVMPKVDGKQFFNLIREKFNKKRFPMVAVSGTMVEHMAYLNEIGADYFIAKGPINQLTVTLNDCITQFESHPCIAVAEKKIVANGDVFPRRDAMTLLSALQFYQAVIESAGVGIIMVDNDTRIINANPRACEIIGMRPADVVNSPICDIFSTMDRIKLATGLKQVVNTAGIRDHIAFYATFHAQVIGTIIAPILQHGQAVGWVIALEPSPRTHR
jgi:PAS domain S-box-containing protein